MKKNLIYSFFFCLLAYAASAQPVDIKFKYLSTLNGLSQSQVTCIYQDRQGFMWFGTHDGLNRYDGYTFTVYKNNAADSTTLSDNYIRVVTEDREGNLWVGTQNGLNRFDRKTKQFFRFPTQEVGMINAIMEDREGQLWVGEFTGLKRYNRKTNTFQTFAHRDDDPYSLNDNAVSVIYEDKQGKFWIGTGAGGLNEFDRKTGRFTHYTNNPADPSSISYNSVSQIREDKYGNLWVGCHTGLNLFDRKTKRFKRYMHDPANPQTLPHNTIYAMLEDSQGNFWLGTNDGGLSLMDRQKGTFTHFQKDINRPQSLGDITVVALYEDRSGNLWVGLGVGGINMYNARNDIFHHYKQEVSPNSLSHNTVRSFLEDREGYIWIGTDGGGLNRWDRKNNQFTHYRYNRLATQGINSDVIMNIYQDKQDNIWMGTWGGGLNKWDKATNRFTYYKNDPADSTSISGNEVRSIMEDRKGNLWIGTSFNGLSVLDRKTNRFTRYRSNPQKPGSLNHDMVLCLYQDSKGTIWVGTLGGVNRFDPTINGFIHYGPDKKKPNSLSNEVIQSFFEDHRGNLWIGTTNGLNRFHPSDQSFSVLTEKHGLPHATIQGITEDGQGNLWVSTTLGLSKFNPKANTYKNFTSADGLQANEFLQNVQLKLRSGEILFGGINGFNIFDPKRVSNNPFIPPVYFTDFQIFNAPVALNKPGSPLKHTIGETQAITLSYKESVLSFEFAALNYTVSEKNQYAYQMEGYDQKWNYVGTKRTATYTNLDPGEYVLHVKATNNDGVWNEKGASIHITITPPFWQTWWFRSLVTALILGSALTFYRVRINALKAQQAKLEQQVEERTAEVVLQKEELQTQAENLLEANNDLLERQEEILQQQEEIQTQSDILQLTVEDLQESKQQIQLQHETLQQVNEQVMKSLHYARTIQQAILPSQKKMAEGLAEHFVLFRPKDVVSGDFYWFSHLSKEEAGTENDLTFVAAVDCTGHGVAGAFMAIIGNTLLNEIINQKHILDPAQILHHLNEGVKLALEKSEEINTAGMDVCLCCLQRGEGNQVRVQFTGAKRPLLFVRPTATTVEKLDGDRRSIGSELTSRFSFTTQELLLDKGTMLYLTSDGYADQNNPARDRMGSKKMLQFIKDSAHLPLTQQKLFFETMLDEYQQGAEQRDDITLMGVQI
ncbi:MAG: two-component regulator propeller domain-containing protein [Bacteroidota bacterium]